MVDLTTRATPIEFIPIDQVGTPRRIQVDTAGLEAELRRSVRGEVRFDAGSRGMYSQDASNYRMVPMGVVIPVDAEDVIAAVAACRRYGAPLHGRGGGTGIPGQTVNNGLLLDFSKYMRRIVHIDRDGKRARVQPGVVLDELRDATRPDDLTFGPDPATHNRCTLGGMIGNDSCGIHSQMAGRTADNIEALDILLYDGTRLTVGRTGEEELEQIIRAGGRRGEIYGRLRALRDRYADEIRARYPHTPRRSSGYNLDELLPEKGFHVARALVGTEGTCALVLEATVHLVYNPPVRSLLVLGYRDVFEAADHIPDVLPFQPVALEGLDHAFIDDMAKKGFHNPEVALMPDGKGWLLCEFGGADKEEADANARKLMDALKKRGSPPPMKLFDDPAQEKHVWHLREEGLGATARVPGEPDNWEGWEDSAVPPEQTGAYLRDLKSLMDRYGYEGALYGHFGQGCVHTRLNFDLETAAGIHQYRHFVEEASDLVARYHGTLSGEHGDGQARGELLTRMYGKELIEAFKEFKSIWDPDWKMNPGKKIAPYGLDENLKLGTHYNPPDPKTHFQFPDDKHSFAYATQRCVGAGVCRRKSGGTMCPSYMVTLEEEHSTRGRARMLFEMLEGNPVTGGWKSEAVKESLDLCLSCKGCKGECPVQVDMATYKAEFLSHYYEGRLRPRHAYAFGLIHWWSRLGGLMPGVVNLFSHAPLMNRLMKAVVGMEPKRDVPKFAPYTFKAWFRRRQAAQGAREQGRARLLSSGRRHRSLPAVQTNGSGTGKQALDSPAAGGPSAARTNRVILWPDTFNDHYHPTTAQAAVEVLEAAGCQVVVPMQDMCCGRPLYDYGMLDLAQKWLQHILDTLKDEIEAGTPLVVLEPSCATVFRDELINLFPQREDARRLSRQTFLLSEYLEQHLPDYQPPALKRKALLHGHCHHKSIMKMTDEENLLRKMGVDFQVPEDGCCGMAGAFGFERGDHYEVAMKCGERALLPNTRKLPADELIITDGFSCREQIRQDTDRTPLHLAQVIQMALHEGEHGTPGDFPERRYIRAPKTAGYYVKTGVILGGAALAIGGALWLAAKRSAPRD